MQELRAPEANTTRTIRYLLVSCAADKSKANVRSFKSSPVPLCVEVVYVQEKYDPKDRLLYLDANQAEKETML